MNGQQRGSVVAATFGLIYLIANSGSLPPWVGTPVRVLGGVGFVVVVVAVARARGGGGEDPMAATGLPAAYWAVVAAEIVALAAGLAVLNGLLDAPNAGVGWVSFVVGVHLVALGVVFGERVFHWLGAAIAACGVIGLVLVASGAARAPVDVVGGLLPGAMLLAAGWWGATGGGERHADARRSPQPAGECGALGGTTRC